MNITNEEQMNLYDAMLVIWFLVALVAALASVVWVLL